MLKENVPAPDFSLSDKDGQTVSLSDFRGKRFVLYFYPKDSTSGCTRQACAYAGLWARYKALGVPVVGISRDSAASHRKFAETNRLPFLLLSDPELTAIRAYDVWKEKKQYGKVSMGVVRTTYVVGPEGTIEWAREKVKPDTDAEEVLAFLTARTSR